MPIGSLVEEKWLAQTKVLPSRPAERRLARFTPGMYSALDVNSVQAGGRTALHLLCGSNSAGAAMYVQTGKRNAEAHLAALTATFAPKLRLPVRPARLVAEYWGHVGFY